MLELAYWFQTGRIILVKIRYNLENVVTLLSLLENPQFNLLSYTFTNVSSLLILHQVYGLPKKCLLWKSSTRDRPYLFLYLEAQLLYNSLCLLVIVTIWRKCDFLGCYRKQKTKTFSNMRILSIFCPSVCLFKRHKDSFLKISWFSYFLQ